MSVTDMVRDQFFERRVRAKDTAGLVLQTIEPNVVLMSQDTARELLRENGYHSNSFQWPMSKTDPPRLYGVRVAYDDTLPRGEIMVGELYQ